MDYFWLIKVQEQDGGAWTHTHTHTCICITSKYIIHVMYNSIQRCICIAVVAQTHQRSGGTYTLANKQLAAAVICVAAELCACWKGVDACLCCITGAQPKRMRFNHTPSLRCVAGCTLSTTARFVTRPPSHHKQTCVLTLQRGSRKVKTCQEKRIEIARGGGGLDTGPKGLYLRSARYPRIAWHVQHRRLVEVDIPVRLRG